MSDGLAREEPPPRLARRRAAVRLAAAGILSLLAGIGLPIAGDDPLRPTLVALPLVVAALLEIGRWAEARGGRRTPPAVRRAEVVLLVALCLVGIGRGSLGFRYPEPVVSGWVAAGLLLLLVHRLGRLLLALRPVLGRRVTGPPPAAFFLLPLVAYLALLPWSAFHHAPDGDEPWYLLLAHSLAWDLDADLADNYARGDSLRFMDRRIGPQPGDPVGPEGERYSRHSLLLPLLLAPFYLVAGRVGALAAMAALAAAVAWMTLRLAGRYWDRRPGEALAAYGTLAFAPPLVIYVSQVWVEVPAALLATIALDRIFALESEERRGGRRDWLVLAGALALLPLLKLRFALIAAGLVGVAWLRVERARRGVLALVALLAAAGGAILVHNAVRYGHPLRHQRWAELTGLHQQPLPAYAKGATGLLFDCAFGLFAVAPIWCLLLPAALLLVRSKARLAADLALVFAPYLLVLAPRGSWHGSWAPPFRYGLVILPLLAVALVPLLAQRRRPAARGALAGLALATLALTVVWIVLPNWSFHFPDGSNRVIDHLAAGLGGDFVRLFPSFVRPRPATWLWPPAVALALCGLWWLPGRRRRRGALAGVALLLAAAAALPVAAHRLVTGRVELEDVWVRKRGGEIYPERWAPARERERGGWRIAPGDSLEAPVVPGSGRVEIALDLHVSPGAPEGLAIEVLAGDRRVATAALPRPPGWRELRLPPLEWPPGARQLGLRLAAPAEAPAAPAVILDGVDLRWLPAVPDAGEPPPRRRSGDPGSP